MFADGPRKKKAGNVAKNRNNDFLVMETNSSSIVSKSSVERLYFAGKRKLYYRYFVKKPVRRSPTINRGYWLRIYALESTVRRFLKLPTRKEQRKVVVNLGCGFDPLPFQILSEEQWKDVVFVDVDYSELIDKKVKIIQETEELSEIVKRPAFDAGIIRAKSENYIAIGCDLSSLAALRKALIDAGIADDSLLFMAEVSITYMEKNDADAVIKLASEFHDASFALMEQIMPCGIKHPFAKTMMAHFESISSPIKSVPFYPTLSSQIRRFKTLGWNLCSAIDLGNFYQNHIPEQARQGLNKVEAFDEWEEFYQFAQHYFLLLASTQDTEFVRVFQGQELSSDKIEECSESGPSLVLRSNGTGIQRKFGAATAYGKDSYIYHGGTGKTREVTNVLISRDTEDKLLVSSERPAARMSHTVEQISESAILTIGGRLSPKEALQECWEFEEGQWKKVPNLPSPRYRHSSVKVENKIMLFGGKDSNSTALSSWILRDGSGKWKNLQANHELQARFGAVLINNPSDMASGILCGGITESGVILNDMWSWRLVDEERVELERWETDLNISILAGRFGAEAVHGFEPNSSIIIGGVAKDGLMPPNNVIVKVDFEKRKLLPFNIDIAGEQPMLVGASCVRTNNSILVLGGGAICFSFGPYWNSNIYELAPTSDSGSPWIAKVEESLEVKGDPVPIGTASFGAMSGLPPAKLKPIPRTTISTAEEFDAVVTQRIPVILEGVKVGDCIEKWTPEYLLEKVAAERKVVIHSSNASHMNFQRKNFSYETVPFSEFLNSAFSPASKDSVYLRSISSSSPSSIPANLASDFPSLAADFTLPPFLSRVTENMHSSPLRISSAEIGMWLHYDVMANILVHVRGKKRFRLYPPSDILHLQFPAGSTNSNILNIFETEVPGTTAYEIELNPGDVLYIPELWPHAAYPLEPCVAVNVFFRNLGEAYAAGRDVYGNRDIGGYENGRRALERIDKGFAGVPREVRRFYLERLAGELLEIARK